MLSILINDNVVLLDQGLSVLNRFSDSDYGLYPDNQKSSIGSHFRHVLDHYDCFFMGLNTSQINYDHRSRNTLIEDSKQAAMIKCKEVMASLKTLEDHYSEDIPLRSAINTGNGTYDCPSTLSRELQFLVSHSVHHYALIKLIGLNQGCSVTFDADFGIAPSTLAYLKNECAH